MILRNYQLRTRYLIGGYQVALNVTTEASKWADCISHDPPGISSTTSSCALVSIEVSRSGSNSGSEGKSEGPP